MQLVRVLLSLQLPFRAVDHLQVRRLIYMLNPDAHIPSPTTIRTQLQKRTQDIEDQLLVDLPPEGKISLALDCWTSPNKLAFMAITGYFIDKNWKYREVVLGFEHIQGSHTGETLAEILRGIVMKHSIANRILAITTDNASNNITLTRDIQQALSFGNFCTKRGHLPCLAHVIQLSLKELFRSI